MDKQAAVPALNEPGKIRMTIIVIVVTHLVGIAVVKGLKNEDFLELTPLQLLSCFGLLIWNHPVRDVGFWRYLIFAFLAGYFVEVAGVATGAIFGTYTYGEVLGTKVLDTPLLIGVNWAMLVYAANMVVRKWMPGKQSLFIMALAGGLLPLALDWFLEPVAIRYGMWSWEGGQPPLQNYIGWYVVGVILSFACQKWACRCYNPIAPWLLAAQFVFFIALQL